MTSDALRPRRRPRRGVSIIGVLGELLITAGLLVVLFLGWQVWWNDIVVGGQQATAAQELTEQWGPIEPAPSPDPSAEPQDYGDPVVSAVAAEHSGFATIYVPRFGADWQRVVGEGVDMSEVLNDTTLGVGHYEGTQMPGEVGNFAVAAHRQTHGGSFNQINQLAVGDPIYVATADGFYTYRYRSTEYVLPTGVGVLDPVPQVENAQAGDRIITLTACNPLFSTAERIVAYGVMESWQPHSAGPPAAIAHFFSGAA